jgi:hypothetical protein
MADVSTPSLEGEILERRYAIVEVTSVHGDWVRCKVFDMQQMTQREAVVQIVESGEHEVQLLPAEEPAEVKPIDARPAEAQPAEAEPEAPAEPEPAEAKPSEAEAKPSEAEAEPAEAKPEASAEPAEPPTAPEPEPARAAEADKAPKPPAPPPAPPPPPSPPLEPVEDPELLKREDLELRREDLEAFKEKAKAKPGKLEAAWFAVGDDADNISEEDRPDADDGDLLIAPSKVEQKATELTTKTYMRYRIDTSNPQLRAARDSSPSAAVPGKSRAWLYLVAAGVGLAVLVVLLLALR